MKNFLVRSLSAAVLVPVVLIAEWKGGLYFGTLMVIVMLAGLREWFRMSASQADSAPSPRRLAVLVCGGSYIVVASLALVWLRSNQPYGAEYVLLVLLVVWAADTGAYLAGSMIGGPKLAPAISPKKTWAGLLSGLGAAGVVGAVMIRYADHAEAWPAAVVAAVFLGFMAALGDLLESYAKRRLNVKDAGALIPGHGGVLDRVDGLFAAGLGAAVVSLLEPGHSALWP